MDIDGKSMPLTPTNKEMQSRLQLEPVQPAGYFFKNSGLVES